MKLIKVVNADVIDGTYKLKLKFNTGEEKVFDFEPLFSSPLFAPLKDKTLFGQVSLDSWTTTWNAGEIDIAPETLYAGGTASV